MKKLITAWGFVFLVFSAIGQELENRIDFLTAVNLLEADFDVIFAFDHQVLTNVEVMAWDDGQSLEDVLATMSSNSDFRFELVGNTVLVIPEEVIPVTSIEISGFVRDQDTNVPLPNAIILVKETGQYMLTDHSGRFILRNVPKSSDLQITFMGYEPKVINASKVGEGFEFKLKNNIELLNEVTVTEMNHSFAVHERAFGNRVDEGTVKTMPNFGEADVVRTMQMLPGVRSTNESSSEMIVRGHGANQVLTQFDGMTMYRTDHFFGNLSAFNSDIIQSAHLHKSAFRAPWGTRASSVMDITSRRGSFDQMSGSIGLNLLNASATLETPIGNDLSILISGRRAFSDVIQSGLYKSLFDNSYMGYEGLNSNEGLLENSMGVESSFYFYDVNAKLSWRIDPNSMLDVSYYNGFDNLVQEDKATNSQQVGGVAIHEELSFFEKNVWGNTGFSTKWSKDWRNGLFTDVQVAHSRFRADQTFYSNHYSQRDSAYISERHSSHGEVELDNLVRETSVKLNAEYSINVDHKLGFGFYTVDYYSGRYFKTMPNVNNSFSSEGTLTGIYGEWQADLTDRLSVIPGIRISRYSEDSRLYREPRLAINYHVNRHLNLKASAGKHYQYMVQVETVNQLLNNNDMWVLANGSDVPVVESNHFVLGGSWVKRGFVIDLEGYYKSTNGLLEFVEVPVYESDGYTTQRVGDNSFYNVGFGRSYGLDLLIKKETGIYNGWVSYSLGRSEVQLPDTNDRQFFPSEFDQTHELKIVNMVSLGNWDFSLNWLYGSGIPYTYTEYSSANEPSNTEETADSNIQLNNGRLPAYHRLDIGIARHIKLNNARITTGLNIQNVYDRSNVRKIVNINDSGDFSSQAVTNLGFTPSIYLKYYF